MFINKIKTGIVSFIFVLFIGGTIISYNIPGSYTFYIPFVIFTALILTGLLLLSLSKSEKKILENNYTFGWLIKFNLLLFIISSISFIGLIILFSLIFPLEEMGVFLYAYLIFYAPLVFFIATVCFSIIPSLVLYKFYSNQKLLTIISSIFIIIPLLLLAFFTTRLGTCDFYNDSQCLANKAIKARDISICEKGRTNSCYRYIAKKTNDLLACEKITTDAYLKYYCILDIGISKKNPQICEKLDDFKLKLSEVGGKFFIGEKHITEYNKESCYLSVQEAIER